MAFPSLVGGRIGVCPTFAKCNTIIVPGRGKTMETAVLAVPTVCATLDKRL